MYSLFISEYQQFVDNIEQVLAEQGLAEYCDPEFVRNTSREMQEALDMTQEQMDRYDLLVIEVLLVRKLPYWA